jgi:ABC-type sugar transport system ATPase subunit
MVVVRPYVRLENIYKRFGDVEALKGVTLDIFTGQVLGLLGENGAGKTT